MVLKYYREGSKGIQQCVYLVFHWSHPKKGNSVRLQIKMDAVQEKSTCY